MICRLTHYQARVVMARIPELRREAMAEHRTPHGPKAHSYDLPAIAWRQIRDHLWLNPNYYGPMGGKLDSQPKALYRAIQLIHQAVIEMEHHPAFEGRCASGEHANVIPAWYVGDGEWSPYPDRGGLGPLVLFVPHVLTLHDHRITEWRAIRSDEMPALRPSWTYRTDAHLYFVEAKV